MAFGLKSEVSEIHKRLDKIAKDVEELLRFHSESR
jgi:hypothetical protein